MFANNPPTPSHKPARIIPANCATPPAILTCFLNSIVIFTRPSETKLTDTTTNSRSKSIFYHVLFQRRSLHKCSAAQHTNIHNPLLPLVIPNALRAALQLFSKHSVFVPNLDTSEHVGWYVYHNFSSLQVLHPGGSPKYGRSPFFAKFQKCCNFLSKCLSQLTNVNISQL